MSDLPQDLWRKILDFGINNSTLTYEDLCSISITCKRLHRLSCENSLWFYLLSSDFPGPITFAHRDSIFYDLLQKTAAKESSSSSTKSQYRIRLESGRECRGRGEARRVEARRRASLEQERVIAQLRTQIVVQRELQNFPAGWVLPAGWLLLGGWVLRELQELQNFPATRLQIRAVLEHENLFDILSAKIQEIESAREKRTRKPTVADLFNSTKANSRGFECVPDRRYPRERTRGFTQQTKSWHR